MKSAGLHREIRASAVSDFNTTLGKDRARNSMRQGAKQWIICSDTLPINITWLGNEFEPERLGCASIDRERERKKEGEGRETV